MATIDVYYPKMQDAVKKLTAKAEEYKKEAGKVTVAAALISIQWSGDARNAFMAQQTQDLEYYKNMIQRINGCSTALTNAVRKYMQADLEAANKISAVKP